MNTEQSAPFILKFEPLTSELGEPGGPPQWCTDAVGVRRAKESRMSALAITPIQRVVRFYEAPIGKKAVMAITGVMLFGYVIAHLIGNLQIYSPNPDQINHYAAFLHSPSNLPLLWG